MSKSNSYIVGVIILSIISAMLLALAFPPLNLFPISFIAFIPLNIIIYKSDKISYYVASSCIFVLIFFGYLLLWVTSFMLKETEAIVSLLTLFTILFLIIFLFYFPAMLISGFISKKMPEFRFLAVPMVFTFMEYMRNMGYLGFPWGIIGYSQWNFSIFIQSADIFGVLGISFFVYLSNSVAAHYLLLYAESTKYKRPYIPALILISSFALIIIYGSIKINIEDSKRVLLPKTKIALIQKSFDPNIAWNNIYTGEIFRKGSKGVQGFAEKFLLKPEKFNNEEKPDGITQNGTVSVKRIANLAKVAALSKPSLIVYPESVTLDSYGFYVSKYKDLYDYGLASNSVYPGIYNTYILYNMIKDTQTYHLLGTTIIKDDTNENAYNPYKYYNGMQFINDSGMVIDEYSKIKLVPGGESYPFQDNDFLLNTFPFKNVISFMYSQFDKAGANRWERGRVLTVFNHPNGYKFSGIICFESAFGDFVRKFVNNGAEVLAVITEDAWSYSDESLDQHFYMSVFRAIENRRDVVHNGNSGVTGHISSTGKIITTIPYWKPNYMIANAALNKDMTIYTRFGEWFVYICFAGICVLLFFATTRTLLELKEKIKQRFFAKKTVLETNASEIKTNNNDIDSVNSVDKSIAADNINSDNNENNANNENNIIDKKLKNNEIVKKEENTNKKEKIANAKKVTDYINDDNSLDIPSLDDLDDIEEYIINNAEDKEEIQAKENNDNNIDGKLNKNEANRNNVDLFSDNNLNYSEEISDIIESSNKDYGIFEENKLDVYSSLSNIIEENEENKNDKKNKNSK